MVGSHFFEKTDLYFTIEVSANEKTVFCSVLHYAQE